MSSTTSDRITVASTIEMRLEAERIRKAEEMKAAAGRFFAAKEHLKSEMKNIESAFYSYMGSASEHGELKTDMEQVSGIRRRYCDRLLSFNSLEIPSETDEINRVSEEIASNTAQCVSAFREQIAPYISRRDDLIKEVASHKSVSELSEQIPTAREKLTGVHDFRFLSAPDLSALEKRAEEMLKLKNEIMHSDCVSFAPRTWLGMIRSLRKAAGDAGAFEFELSKCESWLIERKLEIEDFNEAYLNYTAQVLSFNSMAGENSEKIHLLGRDWFRNADEIRSKALDVCERSAALSRRRYYRSQISEVMKMFGYGDCRELDFGDWSTGTHLLFRDTGTSNALHVSLSGSDAFFIEPVKAENISDLSDSPEKAVRIRSDVMSASEIDEITCMQGKFCSVHPEMVKELERRGVYLDRTHTDRPSAKTAKKIVGQKAAANAAQVKYRETEKELEI